MITTNDDFERFDTSRQLTDKMIRITMARLQHLCDFARSARCEYAAAYNGQHH